MLVLNLLITVLLITLTVSWDFPETLKLTNAIGFCIWGMFELLRWLTRNRLPVLVLAVIGVPDPTWAQNVKAVVVPKAGRSPTAEVLIQHCRERIASYKKPKLVVFVDSLPRQASGLLDRAAVDAAHGGGNYPSVG